MKTDEYLSVTEVSKIHGVSPRNIRRISNNIVNSTNTSLLGKDRNGYWLIHRLLLPRYKPQRVRRQKYFALTIDPCYYYSAKDIDEIMKFVVDNSLDKDTEINYTIEKKKANDQNHLHCYCMCKNRKNLIQLIKIGFSKVSYHQAEIYDLEGWKNYIIKDGGKIKTIIKNNNYEKQIKHELRN
ncbi:MAG: hypothetical protein COB12_13410 [Flavobacterium sp.]|nr:MAG: hypothetical protein COB12_13410 [Flavobacterium sp.]